MCAAAQAPAKNFANLLNTAKGIKKFKKKIPPVEAITQIVESGKNSLRADLYKRLDFTVVYDEKMKQRMAQASEAMFKNLYEKSTNEIDRAKLNAYMHYAMFFIKSPVVIALTQKTPFEVDLNDMVIAMKTCANVYNLEIFELLAQLNAHRDFADILGFKKPAQVLTIFAVGYPESE